jgi:hypothetical protein
VRWGIVAIVGVVALTTGAVPAGAALSGSRVTLTITPGTDVTLSGQVGQGTINNAGTVRLLFRKHDGTAFVPIVTTRSTASGRYVVRTRQTTSGYWKAVYAGNGFRRAASSTIGYQEVKAWRTVTHTRFTKSGLGDYRSDVITWHPTASAKVTGTGKCAAVSEFNFLRINWTGHPQWSYSTATVPFTGVAASGSSFIYPDRVTGYVEITTQDGCSWNVTVTQEIRTLTKI